MGRYREYILWLKGCNICVGLSDVNESTLNYEVVHGQHEIENVEFNSCSIN